MPINSTENVTKRLELGVQSKLRFPHSQLLTPNSSLVTPSQKGFSLVEILIALSIIGLISGVALGFASALRKTGFDAERQSELKEIQSALQMFYADHQTYPLVSELSFGGLFDSRDSQKVYSRAVPTDPTTSGGYCYLPLQQVNSPITATCTLTTESCHYYVLCTNLDSPPSGTPPCSCSGNDSHNYGVSPL